MPVPPPPPSRVTPHYAAGASLVGGRRRDHRRGNKEPSDRRPSNLSARHERFGSSRTKLSLSLRPRHVLVYIYLASGRWRERGRKSRYNNRVRAPMTTGLDVDERNCRDRD